MLDLAPLQCMRPDARKMLQCARISQKESLGPCERPWLSENRSYYHGFHEGIKKGTALVAKWCETKKRCCQSGRVLVITIRRRRGPKITLVRPRSLVRQRGRITRRYCLELDGECTGTSDGPSFREGDVDRPRVAGLRLDYTFQKSI